MNLKTIFLFLLISLFTVNANAKYEKSVVRISSQLSLYDYKHPWKEPKRKSVMGSGVIIDNQYILTAAHVVAHAKTIEIRKSNNRKKYYANIKYISHQADLALLELYDKSFFKNTKALLLEKSVNENDSIIVSGYPLGSKKLSDKKGKVSKVKYHPYSYSDENLLAFELNVAIKEGNSGGAVLNQKGDLIAIAMQVGDSKSYAVPTTIINTFLEDIKDGKVDGFHSNSNSYQVLQNSSLQNYYNSKEIGILITDIDVNETQLKVNDIIYKINGKHISDTPEINSFNQFHIKPVKQSIELMIIRDKQRIKINYRLHNTKKMIFQEFTNQPRFFIFGGLVFTPITRNYLQAFGMKQYEINMLFYQQKRSEFKQESVAWIQKKFHHPINKHYTSKVEIVDKVNGIKVKNFSHFFELIQTTTKKYVVIDFVKKQRVILNKDEAVKSFLAIKKQYQISHDRRLQGIEQ